MNSLRQSPVRLVVISLLLAAAGAGNAFGQQAAASASPFQAAIAGAQKIGPGDLAAYQVKDKTLLAIPQRLLNRLIMWYAEAARFPPSATSPNAIGSTAVRLERVGSRLIVRDESPALAKRGGEDPTVGNPDPASTELPPISVAVAAASIGPVIAQMPIVAEENELILVDITATFSNDLDALSAAGHIRSAGFAPAGVDPARSYIADVDVFPDNLHIRSQLTFRATDPSNPGAGPRPVSIEVGHSLVLLPETPMKARRYDDRVGFFFSEYAEFETAAGAATGNAQLINRFRLEKKDPNAAVSDPVKPIVFYIGQGVPDRWRPYLAAGIESWKPVFEAAGFSNAIQAKQAPTPAEDPNWNPEDARLNVIRWVPQAFANAMGPRVVDPRTGEILFAHILVWPAVIDTFMDYYYLVSKGVDPEVDKLPLTLEKQGQILAYAVAHEVGHSIGLRHNHLGSTTYSVDELRNPQTANAHGPNSSIMAYGRFNYVTQPGDGVTQVMAKQGPADYFAIKWGYGLHGDSPQAEQAELDRLAAEGAANRETRWAAGEMGSEDRWMFDPRVLKENVGSERIEATRLGLATIQRGLEGLDEAAGDNDVIFRRVYEQALGRQDALLSSVSKMVGGELAGEGAGRTPALISALDQRSAVEFLLNEGAASYEIFVRPDLVLRANPVSGDLVIHGHQAKPVLDLLDPIRMALLENQSALAPNIYGPTELAEDVTNILWTNLVGQPHWRVAQQNAYLDGVAAILHPPAASAATQAAIAQLGYSSGVTSLMTTSATSTSFPAYARDVLPKLKARLEGAAASEADATMRLHFLEMARRIDGILK